VTPDEERIAWSGRLFDVVVERWGRYEREIVRHPGAVGVVAVDDEDRVVLVRQRREAVRVELLELPAGTREPGEEPLTTAQRELAEETGLRGGRWRELARFWTSPGFVQEEMVLFAAEGVEEGSTALEDDEDVTVVRIALGDLPACLGEIRDAKTLVGLLLLLRKRDAEHS
jgi:ADP-ribose pyrophosphatase